MSFWAGFYMDHSGLGFTWIILGWVLHVPLWAGFYMYHSGLGFTWIDAFFAKICTKNISIPLTCPLTSELLCQLLLTCVNSLLSLNVEWFVRFQVNGRHETDRWTDRQAGCSAAKSTVAVDEIAKTLPSGRAWCTFWQRPFLDSV